MTLASSMTSSVTEVARLILGVIPTQVEVQSEDKDVIRYRIRRGFGWKLSRVVFSKASLNKLARDPKRDIKIEYLRRDIVNTATQRNEYRYPRNLASGG
jgi:sugar-specific transcriptional regulator TrmB